MKAVYLTSPGHFTTRDVPDPELVGPSDVRLKVTAVGVCGSDLHYYRTGRIGSQVLTEPWIMGHECTARVESVGSAVTQLTPGDRVAVDPETSAFRQRARLHQPLWRAQQGFPEGAEPTRPRPGAKPRPIGSRLHIDFGCRDRRELSDGGRARSRAVSK